MKQFHIMMVTFLILMVIILQIHLSLKQKNIILTCFESCVIFDAADAATFAITDTKLYISVIILSFRGYGNK